MCIFVESLKPAESFLCCMQPIFQSYAWHNIIYSTMSKRKSDVFSQQTKQIQTLFRDFKKMLTKCRELAKQLCVDLPNEALYSTIERTTLMKMALLDLPGLVNLKNSLAKTTSELFDQERDLAYKKEKLEMKERQRENIKRRDSAQRPKQHKSPPLQLRVTPPTERPSQSLDSLRSSRSSDMMRQSKSIEIPIYKAKVQTAQGKMDRISKYIASLKKNIKVNAESAGNKWRVRDYLLTQPTYLQARTLLEKYLMREEEIQRVIAQAVRGKLQHFFSHVGTITKDDNFYYVKVKKPPTSNKTLPQPIITPEKTQQKHTTPIQPAQSPQPFVEASPVQKQAEQDFQEMKAEIERKTQNYAEMFMKMNEVVDSGRQRLNQIREKRKQAFEQEEDIWDEL